MWRAWGPGLWPSSTASTSETPSIRRSCGSFRRRSTGWARRAGGCPSRSWAAMSVCTTRAGAATSIQPRWWARSGSLSASSAGRPGPGWLRVATSCWWAPGSRAPLPACGDPSRWPAAGGPGTYTAIAAGVPRTRSGPPRPPARAGAGPHPPTSLVDGVHDLSDGGLGVALAEMAVRSEVGFRVQGIPDHRELFGEGPSRVLVECAGSDPRPGVEPAALRRYRGAHLGVGGGDRLRVEGLLDLSLQQARAGLAGRPAPWRGSAPWPPPNAAQASFNTSVGPRKEPTASAPGVRQ